MHLKNISKANKLIGKLSFDEYVLIDCLSFNAENVLNVMLKNKNIAKDYVPTLNFIALSEQGFINIFNELMTVLSTKVDKNHYHIKLFNNQIVLSRTYVLHFIIRYAKNSLSEENKSTDKIIKELIDLPGLDFYKCYYDGVKIHTTPEALQCYKTGQVQYTGKVKLSSLVICDIFDNRKFKDEFWKELVKYCFRSSKLEHLFLIDGINYETRKKRIYDFIKQVIFKNPIRTLC
jgi:hypothetical protein